MKTVDIRAQMRAQLSEKGLFELAKNYAYQYMDSVGAQRVHPSPEAVKGLACFQEAMPELSSAPANILEMLHQSGSPATTPQTAGRYFGFVNGGAIPVAVAARWLADVWDQNAALHVISPVAAKLEEVCESWLAELLGLPRDTAAGFVSGTSTATLCGLAAGRNELLRKAGWDVNAQGLFGAPEIKVVVGEQAHATVFKALALLGLGKERVIRVPADSQGRMDAAQMPPLDQRTLLIIQAGNVNTGAFDPLDRICEMANSTGAWVHIDGAFGLWAAASERKRHLTLGLEKADSWSVDAHKTLNSPYDCGVILCKRREALIAALQATGSYILYGEQRDNMLYTPEMSRRARGVELWATLKYLGRRGVAELVDGLCAMAEQFAARLQDHGFKILNEVVFNQILVACETPELTGTTLENVQESGECWCGGATWNGEPVIRISVCSWATTPEDIERSAAAFVAAREKAERRGSGSDESISV